MPVRLALVEDNPLLLQTLSRNLSLFDEVQLVFTAGNGQQTGWPNNTVGSDDSFLPINMFWVYTTNKFSHPCLPSSNLFVPLRAETVSDS